MSTMKILWLCNCPLIDSDATGSGAWLDAMARGLLDSGAIELGIIAPGSVHQLTRSDYRQVKQWLIPWTSPCRDGLPKPLITDAIVAVVKDFSPDLIHIWGTEYFWGLFVTRGLLKYPSLLEMQGVKEQIAKVYCGGLTFSDQLQSIGIKEILRFRTMHTDRRDFENWGLHEKEIIRNHSFVGVQSSWVAAHVKTVNPVASLYHIDLVLRQPFYADDGWQWLGQTTLFCTSANPVPYKGLHVAIRALSLLKKRMPNVRLRIAGAHQRPGLRQDGYIRWLNRLIRKLGLGDTIEWLGPLNADQIVSELKRAGAVVIPTYIENCCTAMQEAMAIGTPVVVSFAGGIPSLGRDEESCLFFPPGDEAMCAYQMERVLTEESLAVRLSKRAREIALIRNNRQRIVQCQLDIYRQILNAVGQC